MSPEQRGPFCLDKLKHISSQIRIKGLNVRDRFVLRRQALLVPAVLIGRVQATAALSVCPIACELAPNASHSLWTGTQSFTFGASEPLPFLGRNSHLLPECTAPAGLWQEGP